MSVFTPEQRALLRKIENEMRFASAFVVARGNAAMATRLLRNADDLHKMIKDDE